MAVCDAQELISSSQCYTGYLPYEQEVMMTQLMCNLLDKIENGGAITCDPQELLDQGVCFQGKPVQILKAIQLSLLCDISNAV